MISEMSKEFTDSKRTSFQGEFDLDVAEAAVNDVLCLKEISGKLSSPDYVVVLFIRYIDIEAVALGFNLHSGRAFPTGLSAPIVFAN